MQRFVLMRRFVVAAVLAAVLAVAPARADNLFVCVLDDYTGQAMTGVPVDAWFDVPPLEATTDHEGYAEFILPGAGVQPGDRVLIVIAGDETWEQFSGTITYNETAATIRMKRRSPPPGD